MSSPFLNPSFGAGINSGLNIVDPSGFDLGKNFLTPSSTSSAGGMAFPFLAAATVAAPIIGGIFGNRQAANTREAGAETTNLAAQSARERGLFDVAGRNFLLDEELGRQKDAALFRNSLLNAADSQYFDTRQQGFDLAGKGYSPTQIAQFTDMFGGYA
jgi:hypothetical protein